MIRLCTHIALPAGAYAGYERNREGQVEKQVWRDYRIKILCGVFYMFALLNMLGISTNLGRYSEEADSRKTEAGSEASEVQRTDGQAGKGQKEAPEIALTFDDGPREGHTGKLLDGLKERDVKASFFLIGEYAEASPELVKRIDQEGHLIGNHTYHHVDIAKISDEEAKEEIRKTDEVVFEITGKHIEYVRPPFGVWQKELEAELDVLPVMWTVDPLDWTTENVDEIVNKVVTEAEEGDIILLHDCYDSSVEAALRIVDILKAEGYRFVTVDELILE